MLGTHVCALSVCLLLADAVAQEERAAAATLQVHCFDGDGKPVAGAEVHVWQTRRMPDGLGNIVAGGPFTSGADGVAATSPLIDYDGGKFDRWVYARVPGKIVGALRQLRFDERPVDAKLVVTLFPSRELRGRVKVPDGVRPETVRIRVRSLSQIVGEELWGQVFPRQIGLDCFENSLPERFDCQATKEGTFVLADMPSKPFIILGATGPGIAQMLWGNAMLPGRQVPDSIELVLEKESCFGGMVGDAKGQPVADAKVELRISSEAQSPATAWFLARTDTAGRFQLDGLPAGPFELTVQSPAGVMRPERVNLAKAESKLDAKIALEDGVEVAGVVVAFPSGEPVEGVGVSAITPDDLMLALGHSGTDTQGRFSLRLATGKAKLYFSRVPSGFVYPQPQIVMTIDVGPDDAELKKLRLEVGSIRSPSRAGGASPRALGRHFARGRRSERLQRLCRCTASTATASRSRAPRCTCGRTGA